MADEMVTARVDEHGRMVRLYAYVGRDAQGAEVYLATSGSRDGGDVQLRVAPGADPPLFRSVTADGLRQLLEAEEARSQACAAALGDGPSQRAIDAVIDQLDEVDMTRALTIAEARNVAEGLLAPAHDPALGLDRSVCLCDVVESLRTAAAAAEDLDWGTWAGRAADHLASEFGGGA